MISFEAYAPFYDMLNAAKDYCGEAQYVTRLIRDACPHARALLDLGCGTGRHAQELASRGFSVHGVDRSAAMIALALGSASRLPPELRNRISFEQGNISGLELGRTFDAVTSLFHVLDYQTTEEEARGALESAARHLAPDGVLVFDYWYGPAVLAQKPESRERRVENDSYSVVRRATPTHEVSRNLVFVQYDFEVHDKRSGKRTCFREKHPMRYFFEGEVERLLAAAGLERTKSEAWMSGSRLDASTWSALAVARPSSP